MKRREQAERVTSARLLVAQLRVHGVERVFCVPGESFLTVLDALVDAQDIHVVTCRHESAATMMAEAYGRLTGQPGVVFVTRGPGATNASAGVHIAHQNSAPLVLFIGQVERTFCGREAFQEIEYGTMFRGLTKWAAQIEDGRRIPELVSRGLRTAVTGRPGPVVLALPEDMLEERFDAVPAPYCAPAASEPGAHALGEIASELRKAERPLLIVGGGGWSDEAAASAKRFVERWELPVCCTFRCNDYVDNESPNYIGNLGLGANPDLCKAVDESDLVLLVGARLGEASSNGYRLLNIPRPHQKLVHIHPVAEELGRVYQPDRSVVAASGAALCALADLEPPAKRPWRKRLAALRGSFLEWTTPGPIQGDLQMGEIMVNLRQRLPADAIVTNGAGNFAVWPNRYHRFTRYGTMLAPVSGSMGYGVPAAISAKMEHPERVVVAFTGDGDFLMTGQELATAVKEKLSIIILLLNNNMYGTIRMHQERRFPERVSATDLLNPDFVRLAESYGACGQRVTKTDEFPAAFERAVSAGKPALIELVPDPNVLSPTHTLASLREMALIAN